MAPARLNSEHTAYTVCTVQGAKESRFILQSINEKEKVAHELQKQPVLPVLAAAVLVQYSHRNNIYEAHSYFLQT